MNKQLKRLAIIGAGSSGLITLKYALEHLKDWEIICFEKGSHIRGCWGNAYSEFISTSTKYTTQFSCHQTYSLNHHTDANYDEFFKGSEYGDYLENFADQFNLRRHIKLNTPVTKISRIDNNWSVTTAHDPSINQQFSQIIICTGLTKQIKHFESPIPQLRSDQDFSTIRDKTLLVIGGGESAADTANRLARPELNNKVYLSLKQGIRVSPRYHPIRGVPSDFLRNRLMLSIHPQLRNKIGQRFVESRIRFQKFYQHVFPSSSKQNTLSKQTEQRRRDWDLRLTRSAKDELFNMFHNKSDGFLDAVGEGRIKIIGTPIDSTFTKFKSFDSGPSHTIKPDWIVPHIGYQAKLDSLFDQNIKVSDFYQGCLHKYYNNLFIIGYARPIIGNIPTISEQQALYAIKHIEGSLERPQNILNLYQAERRQLATQFSKLNLDALYPVEMFPYCDSLAHKMGTYPTLKKTKSFRKWLRIQLSPASTNQYLNHTKAAPNPCQNKIYTPHLLNCLLTFIRLFDLIYRRCSRSN